MLCVLSDVYTLLLLLAEEKQYSVENFIPG